MINFVIFSSKSFMPRTKVCLDSIRQFYRLDEAVIHFTEYQSDNPGNYVEGMAKARLEKCKELLEQGLKNVVLLGADCVLYDRIDSLFEPEGDIILVPHVLTFPSVKYAAQLYKTGHANADVVLFRDKNCLTAIDWILSQPIEDQSNNGIFYEQTYLSALPFFKSLDVGICFDPGINIAYFNLHEARSYPKLIQYSGYLDGQPGKISKYYNGPTPEKPILDFFLDYQKRIDKNK